jgi:hypothetical protein
MDTGASSHFASDPGILTFVSPSPPSSRTIIVGNGSSLLILASGHAWFPVSSPSCPLYLRNVLVASNIVKNLVSVCKFTTDNCVPVEFDPFGFFVKDLPTKTEILRSNSSGALYPVLPTITNHPQALLVADHVLWHRRLGHHGCLVMDSLVRSSVIPREKNKHTSSLCHACQLGNHVHLPFFSSNRVTTKCF